MRRAKIPESENEARFSSAVSRDEFTELAEEGMTEAGAKYKVKVFVGEIVVSFDNGACKRGIQLYFFQRKKV